MKQHAAVLPFRRLQHGPMTTPRELLRLLIVTLCLSFAQPFAALAQTSAPAPLPPAAQEALNKGIIAARVPDYLLAIRFFEEARKLAPTAPVVYLNLGLAESRIPGRELRAMAWFGAYLSTYPDAPNAAAVKEQIRVLNVRNQSNVSRLIKAVQDAASQASGDDKDLALVYVAELWAKAGDIAVALKTAELVHNRKGQPQEHIAKVQAAVGDFSGAQKTVDLIQDAFWKKGPLIAIAEAQIKAGDVVGAQKTFASALKNADLIKDADSRSNAQAYIAKAQAESGDIAAAQKTVDLIQRAFNKCYSQVYIADARIKAGDISGALQTLAAAQKTANLIQEANLKSDAQGQIAHAQAVAGLPNWARPTRPSTSDTQPPIQPVITASEWLKKLDDDNRSNECPLNTGPFLDLASYLKSLPPSGHPYNVFKSLRETAGKIVSAQNVITGMLRQQAKR